MDDSAAAPGSKRNSLRFNIKAQPVRYKTAYEDGEAFLVNISTGGCAVRKASVPVALTEKILFSFDIHSLDEPLEIRAICARLEDDGFAVQFLGIDDVEANRIIKLLAGQARSEKSSSLSG
ncbi:MAG: hypothetical protein BA866_03000 [Desulfobulbaceae bacterium S5133MH15]|nr:MAG: hypothetical protein BA866_03000 [Desulfobulbaceae bacterium S5133MH15]